MYLRPAVPHRKVESLPSPHNRSARKLVQKVKEIKTFLETRPVKDEPTVEISSSSRDRDPFDDEPVPKPFLENLELSKGTHNLRKQLLRRKAKSLKLLLPPKPGTDAEFAPGMGGEVQPDLSPREKRPRISPPIVPDVAEVTILDLSQSVDNKTTARATTVVSLPIAGTPQEIVEDIAEKAQGTGSRETLISEDTSALVCVDFQLILYPDPAPRQPLANTTGSLTRVEVEDQAIAGPSTTYPPKPIDKRQVCTFPRQMSTGTPARSREQSPHEKGDEFNVASPSAPPNTNLSSRIAKMEYELELRTIHEAEMRDSNTFLLQRAKAEHALRRIHEEEEHAKTGRFRERIEAMKRYSRIIEGARDTFPERTEHIAAAFDPMQPQKTPSPPPGTRRQTPDNNILPARLRQRKANGTSPDLSLLNRRQN
ncbi:hypothetical protein DXG01_013890 [Tephrocybe rancida]|nr:hypothetical protein DXG01_013890 [Tephrocybe rancida]